jgi:hypothetical protein
MHTDKRVRRELSLASISTRNNSVTRLACFGDSVTTQANWMISFLPPNQDIDVG